MTFVNKTGGPLFPATSMPDPDWWQALWPDPEAVLRALGAAPGLASVDLCCGDGLFTAPLALLAHPAPVWGVDLLEEMGQKTQAALERAGAANGRVVVGDAMALDRLLPQPVDWVVIGNTFHGVPYKEDLGRAVYRALKPGGRLAVINWHKTPREETPVLGQPRGPQYALRMTPEETFGSLAGCGLMAEQLVELPPYHYGAVLVRP